MTTTRSSLAFVGILTAALLTASPSARANTISVNVGARGANIDALTPAEVAGAAPVANWNDISTSTGFEGTLPSAAAGTIKDSTGAIVPGMSVTFGGQFGIQIGYNYGPDGTHDADLKLMSGFARGAFDADKGLTLAVTNIPYPTYDLYVYADTFGSLVTQYTVNGNTYYGLDSSPGNFILANFVFSQFTTTSLSAALAEAAAPATPYNYVKFSGLTGATLNLSAFTAPATVGGAPAGGEEGIQGFQIVNAVPEPAAATLCASALMALAVVRRRRTDTVTR